MLGLTKLKMDAEPSTIYFLQYSPGGCKASCAFCTQARVNIGSKDFLSRIIWPRVRLEDILGRLKGNTRVKRVCFQAVIKDDFIDEAIEISRRLSSTGIPLSIAITPVNREVLYSLYEAGVERLGIGLDAATPKIFRNVNKPYTWEKYLDFIRDGLAVFGEKKVHIHLIYGLGESEEEFLRAMKMLYKMGADVSLFSFTPIRGTPLANAPQPSISGYRVMQVLRFMLSTGQEIDTIVKLCGGKVYLKRDPRWLRNIHKAVLTSGCPWCNRPFYNESPRMIYNYPNMDLVKKNMDKILRELSARVVD